MAGWQDGAAERLEQLTDDMLDSVARADSTAALDPTTLLFLLRRYTATDREDLREVLGEALAAALAGSPAAWSGGDEARWLTLFAEARVVSDDVRLFTVVADLDKVLRARWRLIRGIAAAAEDLEACLVSASAASSRDLLQSTLDEMERFVGGSYRPGQGVGAGRFGDQVAVSSLLLEAFALTGRLPYSMLAEELMQFLRRTLWDVREGGFVDAGGTKPFAENCKAARVCCRLASLHRDDAYRRVAVLAGSATYAEDAELVLASQAPAPGRHGFEAALYGIALAEWLHLQSDLK